MKKSVKVICFVLTLCVALCAMSVNVFADVVLKESGGYTFMSIGEDKVCILKYSGEDAEVVIPSTLDGSAVTQIGNGSSILSRDAQITSVIIPDTVTEIYGGAFEGAAHLKSITIPNSVTKIGALAFDGCISLLSFTLPESLKSIGSGAFYNCPEIKCVTIPKSVNKIGDYAFGYLVAGAREGDKTIDGFTIRGYKDTAAEAYAKENDFTFVDIDDPVTDKEPEKVGDADGDGTVTIVDATVIQRRLAELDTAFYYEKTADADEDGEVTIMDATAIQRYIADLPTSRNIGKKPGDWINKEKAEKWTEVYAGDLVIVEIHPDCFIAESVIPLPTLYKINGSISEEWCVGDKVFCVCNNVYYEDSTDRFEGDLVSIAQSTFVPDPNVAYKPVIYLYPEEETQVSVKLSIDGELLKSEPAYGDGWMVTASSDGTLTDASGVVYDYLFWEAKLNADYDMTKGFCVKGEDTEVFLTDALKQLGLNEKEADEFLDFWLPIMEDNAYNVISFQNEAYTDAAALNVRPQPDTVIRVFMTYYASDEAVDIPAQELSAPERSGFTLVEWGGSMVK